MTEYQQQLLEETNKIVKENNTMLKSFTKLYKDQLAGKEFSPNPTDTSLCPEKLE